MRVILIVAGLIGIVIGMSTLNAFPVIGGVIMIGFALTNGFKGD